MAGRLSVLFALSCTLIALLGFNEEGRVTSPTESNGEIAWGGGMKTDGALVTGNFCKIQYGSGICYSAGGHSFKCDDDTEVGALLTGSDSWKVSYTHTCYPLKRYTFEGCESNPTNGPPTIIGNCDFNRDVFVDP